MPTLAPAPRALRFETFELDLRTSEMRKGGVKLRLQGQPLQLLAILLQSAGENVEGVTTLKSWSELAGHLRK